MSAIVSIRIEDRYLELASPDLKPFGELFEIDSVHLLLGKNGSGKTQFLLEIARAMTSLGMDESTHVYLDKSGRHRDLHDFCTIYYTALPYRRNLVRRTGLIDASPRSKTVNEADRLQQLGNVALALGIDTKLTGVFGYTRNAYRSILIPALRKASEIDDDELSSQLLAYEKLIRRGAEAAKELKEFDLKTNRILTDIEQCLDELLSDRFDNIDHCLYLTALEYWHNKHPNTNIIDVATAFLSYAGIIKTQHHESFIDIDELVINTREVLNNYAFKEDFDDRGRKHSFVIDSIHALDSIRQYETPIKIEWSNLSSGLHALVDQFSRVGEAIETAVNQNRSSILLLIDEGDAYLHLDWQRKYISLMNKYLGSLKRRHGLHSLQLILASHSPLLAADIPGQLVTSLDSDMKFKTFAAPMEEVISNSFESNSIGEFAAKKINEIYIRAKKSKLTATDRVIMESIGDFAIYAALSREVRGDN